MVVLAQIGGILNNNNTDLLHSGPFPFSCWTPECLSLAELDREELAAPLSEKIKDSVCPPKLQHVY